MDLGGVGAGGNREGADAVGEVGSLDTGTGHDIDALLLEGLFEGFADLRIFVGEEVG